jgi:hypothetical protein
MNDLANIDRSSHFLSGPWTGFFLQAPVGRDRTDMNLAFLDGRVTGDGVDRVGQFTMDGWYDPMTGNCEWKKQYIGKHAVHYRGMHDEHGIWGVWEIKMLFGLLVSRGGFHIWPLGMEPGEASDQVERAVAQAMQNAASARGSVAQNPYLWATLIKVILLAALLATAYRELAKFFE